MLTLRWTDERPQLICMHFLFRDRPRDHSEVGGKKRKKKVLARGVWSKMSCNCNKPHKHKQCHLLHQNITLWDFSFLFLQLQYERNFMAFGKLCRERELDGVLIHIFRLCVIYTNTRKHYTSQGSQLESWFLAARALIVWLSLSRPGPH